MASQTVTLTVATQLEDAGFTEAADHMRGMQDEIDQTTTKTDSWKSSLNAVKGAMVVGAILLFYKTAVAEASAAEQSQLRLKTSVESTGLAWATQSASINAFTEALTEMTRFTKVETEDALNILIQRTNDVAVAQANLETVMGISIATGQSMEAIAERVGRAAQGESGDIEELAKQFGIVGDEAKDAEFVLRTLNERFGKLARDEDTVASSTAKLTEELRLLAEQAGEGLGGTVLLDFMANLIKAGKELVATNIAGVLGMIVGVVSADADMIAEAWKTMTAASSNAWKIMSGKGTPGAEDVKTGGKLVTDGALAMSEELKAILDGIQKDTDARNRTLGASEVERLKVETEMQKEALLERYDFQKLAATEQAEILLAIDQNAAAKRKEIELASLQERIGIAMEYANIVGDATGKMLAGQTDAWKDASIAIIDMIVNQVRAVIMANAYAAASKEVAKKGYAGIATGAGLIAWGLAKSAAVTAIGSAAKSGISGGGGGGVSAGGGGGGGAPGLGGPGGGTASEPGEKAQDLTINLLGDMYGEEAFLDNIARKLSEAVENRDVRLISTSTTIPEDT